jgi:hypothetical protein
VFSVVEAGDDDYEIPLGVEAAGNFVVVVVVVVKVDVGIEIEVQVEAVLGSRVAVAG